VPTLIVLLGIVTIQASSAGTTPRAAVQSAPAPVQVPAGWTEAHKTMLSLLGDGKCPEAIVIGEQWVAKHPSFAEAQLALGGAYDNVASGFCGRPRETGPNSTKQFEKAAVHLRRGFELGGGESPWIAIRTLIDVYGLLGLNRPDEQEKVAREAVVRYPAEPLAYAELISSLLRRGAEAEAAKAVAAAKATLPKTAAPRLDMARTLAFRATGQDLSFKLSFSREARMTMARIALEMLDDVLAISPGHKQALREKAELIRAQAELPNEPPLSASRPPADELGVRGTLRAILSAQISYSTMCGAGFYAPTLAALAKPRAGEKFGFFSSSDVPPGGAKILEKHRYAIEMTAPPSPKSPAGCNGVPAGQSAETWSATARPLPGYSGKSYRIDGETLTEIK
jgi:hypothetical protein